MNLERQDILIETGNGVWKKIGSICTSTSHKVEEILSENFSSAHEVTQKLRPKKKNKYWHGKGRFYGREGRLRKERRIREIDNLLSLLD